MSVRGTHGCGTGCIHATQGGTFDASASWNRDRLASHRLMVHALKSGCSR